MFKRVIKKKQEKDLKKGEKGLSTIVATLLIILLTLVAVGIIWIVVRNVIQGGSEQVFLGKFTLDLEISQVQRINDSALNITIKRNVGGGDFVGIIFVAEDENNTETIKKNVSMNELDIKRFQLYFTIINTSRLRKVSITPVFRLESGREINGDVEDEYKVGSIDVNGIVEEEMPPEDSCIYNSDCTTDYNSSTLCFNNDVYKTFHNFSCVSETCADSTSQILHQDCSLTQECINGVCVSPPESCGAGTCGSGEYCFTEAGICLLQVSGNTYFVATNGNDNNPGNFTHPWGTWQKAVTVSHPGDITYIRGGLYQPTNYIGYYSSIGMIISPKSGLGANGTKDNPIRYYNYPLERPILDGSLMTTNQFGWLSGISIENAEYIHLRGLTVRNIHQTPPNFLRTEKPYSEVYGVSSSGANMRFENMIVHDIDGRGFQHWSFAWNDFDAQHSFDTCIAQQNSLPDGNPSTCVYQIPLFESDNTSWINCDAYNLYDIYAQDPGNAADGWKVHGYYGNYYYWEGCRAFNYSDDGFDPSGQSYRTFKNCWAMSTDKYRYATPGDEIEGNGFKMTGVRNALVPNYVVGKENFVRMENSIAANCKGLGFYNDIAVNYQEQWPNNGIFYNNFAYKNLIGYNIKNGSIYRNNIVYESKDIDPIGEKYELASYLAWYNESTNSWIYNDPSPGSIPWWYYNPAFNVTDYDFASLDTTQLMRPRKADGSLPDITFGHLKNDSDLIDGGSIIPGYHCSTSGEHPSEYCRVWYGSAPDLGPFESNY